MTAPALNPPTQVKGFVDSGAFFSLLTEAYELVPDLQFPTSILTYGELRRDAQATAVIQAYTLPIRRATWAIDPSGCRDEVVRLVADDMGLPVLGDDKPGPARTRGMSWAEHLRTALQHLVWGFMPFELLADVSTGQARLVNAYERVPQTISFIHTNRAGDFTGVSQIGLGGADENPEIPADRMALYTHDREGSAYHGNSILRSAFAPWILKRECMRILGASSRRWGMGVPTLRALPGTTPSPEQMAAAAAAAEAMRGGETAGMAVPPGFMVEIQGMVGQVPDTLGFLKWLDQQISRTCLAGFLDLADTKFGSRALGSSFVDLFTLSISAVASYVADVATRQIAARIVDWNWNNEPVPRVTVSDIGTKHEITAEAIQALMAAGAITPDPALEEYMRSAFQLPQRSIPWVPPVRKGGPATGGLAPDGGGGDAVAASAQPAARPRRKRSASGQLALPIAAADGEPAPASDETDAQAQQQAWEQTRAQILADWPGLSQPMVDDLAQQAAEASDSGDLARLATIAVSAAVVAGLVAALTPSFTHLAGEAVEHVLADGAAHGVTVAKPADAGAVSAGQAAALTASLVATGYGQAATRKAMQVAGGSADDVKTAVTTALTDMGTSAAGLVADQVGAGLSAAQTAGRQAAYEAAGKKVVGWRSVEHLDQNTCANCAAEDHKVYETRAEMEAAYPVAGLKSCLGGARCRGYARAIWK